MIFLSDSVFFTFLFYFLRSIPYGGYSPFSLGLLIEVLFFEVIVNYLSASLSLVCRQVNCFHILVYSDNLSKRFSRFQKLLLESVESLESGGVVEPTFSVKQRH